jgi:hypothetical protein
MVDDRFVSLAYLATMRIPLLAGESCRETSGPGPFELLLIGALNVYLAG